MKSRRVIEDVLFHDPPRIRRGAPRVGEAARVAAGPGPGTGTGRRGKRGWFGHPGTSSHHGTRRAARFNQPGTTVGQGRSVLEAGRFSCGWGGVFDAPVGTPRTGASKTPPQPHPGVKNRSTPRPSMDHRGAEEAGRERRVRVARDGCPPSPASATVPRAVRPGFPHPSGSLSAWRNAPSPRSRRSPRVPASLWGRRGRAGSLTETSTVSGFATRSCPS